MEKHIIQENSGNGLGQSVPHGSWTNFDTGVSGYKVIELLAPRPRSLPLGSLGPARHCRSQSLLPPLARCAPGGPVMGHSEQLRAHAAQWATFDPEIY